MNNSLLKLETPCGIISIVDENSNNVPFTLCENKFDYDYEFEDSSGEIKSINTKTNYSVTIKISDLKLDTKYKIFLDGTKMDFGDSDEKTECVSGEKDGYFIALGAYSHNDEEKMDQAYMYSKKMGYLEQNFIMEPPEYDESNFEWYDVEMLENKSGFLFWLIDTKREFIFFDVAWIKSEPGEEDHYESAVQYWTT